MPKMPKTILLGLFVGILSGLIVDALLYQEQQKKVSDYIFQYDAEFIFGIITAPFFNHVVNSNRRILNIFLWTLLSGLSYYAAVLTTTTIHDTTGVAFSYLVGGIVGALVLIVTFHFLFGRLRTIPMVITLVAGGLLPYILSNLFGSSPFVFWLYPLWQGVITTLLTYALFKHQKIVDH